MSTISDALKKAQKQRLGHLSSPITPPSEPPRDTWRGGAKPEPLPPHSSGKPSFILIFMGVAIVAVGVLFYLRKTSEVVRTPDSSQAPASKPEVSVVPSNPERVVLPPKPVSVGEAAAPEVAVSRPAQSKVVRSDIPVLGGIFYSEKNSVAIINGSSMKEGEKVGAYQVVKILTYSVTLKCDGEEIELRLK